MTQRILHIQKGLSIAKFIQRYATEDDCRRKLFELRWPKGFICPICGNKTYCELNTRKVYQCNRCHSQISITAGTVFHASNLPLTKWFLAIYLLTQNKREMSALSLSRQLGISYNAARRVKQKLTQVITKRSSNKKIAGHVIIEDANRNEKGRRGRENLHIKGKTPYAGSEKLGGSHMPYNKFSHIDEDRSSLTRQRGNHHTYSTCIIDSSGLKCISAEHNTDIGQEPTVQFLLNWIQITMAYVKRWTNESVLLIGRKFIFS